MDTKTAVITPNVNEPRQPLFHFEIRDDVLQAIRTVEQFYATTRSVAVSGAMTWQMPCNGQSFTAFRSGETTLEFEYDKRTWIVARETLNGCYKKELWRSELAFHKQLTESAMDTRKTIADLKKEIERLNKCVAFVVEQLPEKKRLDYMNKRDQYDNEQCPF